MKISALSLFILVLFASNAEALDFSGRISVKQSDGTVFTASDIPVFVAEKGELDTYLRDALPAARSSDAVLRADLSFRVSMSTEYLTADQASENQRKTNQDIVELDEIIPDILVRFPGKTIASTLTDADCHFKLSAPGSFYVVVMVKTNDEALKMDFTHVWVIPSDGIVGNYLILDQDNETRTVISLYRKYYPDDAN